MFPRTGMLCLTTKTEKDGNRAQQRKSKQSAAKEMESIRDQNVLGGLIKLSSLPTGTRVLGTHWIFKWKQDSFNHDKYTEKARLVVKGYKQISGVDYTESYCPVVNETTVNLGIVLGLYYKHVLKQDWIEHVIDVETAVLHAERLNSDKKTYIKVPLGSRN